MYLAKSASTAKGESIGKTGKTLYSWTPGLDGHLVDWWSWDLEIPPFCYKRDRFHWRTLKLKLVKKRLRWFYIPGRKEKRQMGWRLGRVEFLAI